MRVYRRYAIYHLPAGPLADFGAAWLGWDAAAGVVPPRPAVAALPVPLERITEAPRRYGFHGTLKAPFRLAPGRRPDDLACTARALAATLPAVSCGALKLRRLGPFLALVPDRECRALNALAGHLVERLDIFRAPPEEAELDRRRAAGLSPRQETLLRRWGYPNVMEEFRFHLTLTGRLDPRHADVVEAALVRALRRVLPTPLRIDDVALLGEDEDGFFHLIERLPLAG